MRWRWTARRALLVAGVGAAILWGMSATATTRHGVDFQVSTKRIPLYVKALDFFHRHEQYRLLAEQIVKGVPGDQQRVLAVFRWTREHIPATPTGWPVVDDHVLHIIIRGHGMDDQMADVFTTLSTYAGVPAFWRPLQPSDGGLILTVSFAKVDGAWRVFDVAHNLIFADAQGRLVDIETLISDPALTDAIAGPVRPAGVPYSRYLQAAQPFTIPDVLRAQRQMPWPRLKYEVGRMMRGKG